MWLQKRNQWLGQRTSKCLHGLQPTSQLLLFTNSTARVDKTGRILLGKSTISTSIDPIGQNTAHHPTPTLLSFAFLTTVSCPPTSPTGNNATLPISQRLITSQNLGAKMADITPQRAPATIHSLAPEIMARVLELVEPADDWQTVPARHLAMCRTSLVCRSWTLEARIILWRKLAIGREGQAERILASPALGSFRTQEVAFWGSVNLTASSTAEVLARLHGVKHLELLFFDRRLKDRILDSAIFGLLSVKGA